MSVINSLGSLSSALPVLILTVAGLIHKGNLRLRLQRRPFVALTRLSD